MSIYSFSFSLSLSSLFSLANFAAMFEGFVLLLALPRLTCLCGMCNVNGKTFSGFLPSPAPISSFFRYRFRFVTYTHPVSPIFSLIFWHSFFNSHFFVPNPRYCVIIVIHSVLHCNGTNRRGKTKRNLVTVDLVQVARGGGVGDSFSEGTMRNK